MPTQIKPANWLLGLVGVIVGGAAGFFLFVWLVRQGYYAMMVPGAALGLLGGILLRSYSQAFGVVCAVLAVLLGLFTEWWTAPLLVDDSFKYFVTHLNQLKPVTLIMIGLGGLCAYWFGQGHERFSRTRED
jgi:hypothetical protein